MIRSEINLRMQNSHFSNNDHRMKPIEIMRASFLEATFFKLFLESSGIESMKLDIYHSSLQPNINQPVRIYVRQKDLHIVRPILMYWGLRFGNIHPTEIVDLMTINRPFEVERNAQFTAASGSDFLRRKVAPQPIVPEIQIWPFLLLIVLAKGGFPLLAISYFVRWLSLVILSIPRFRRNLSTGKSVPGATNQLSGEAIYEYARLSGIKYATFLRNFDLIDHHPTQGLTGLPQINHKEQIILDAVYRSRQMPIFALASPASNDEVPGIFRFKKTDSWEGKIEELISESELIIFYFIRLSESILQELELVRKYGKESSTVIILGIVRPDGSWDETQEMVSEISTYGRVVFEFDESGATSLYSANLVTIFTNPVEAEDEKRLLMKQEYERVVKASPVLGLLVGPFMNYFRRVKKKNLPKILGR